MKSQDKYSEFLHVCFLTHDPDHPYDVQYTTTYFDQAVTYARSLLPNVQSQVVHIRVLNNTLREFQILKYFVYFSKKYKIIEIDSLAFREYSLTTSRIQEILL